MSSTAQAYHDLLPAKLSPARTADLAQLIDGLDLLDSLFQLPTRGEGGSVLLGRFHIRRRLGAGRYGVVFLAEDPELGRRVVVKVPQPAVLADPDQLVQCQVWILG